MALRKLLILSRARRARVEGRYAINPAATARSRDRAGDLLHLEALDDVADLDVVVILEGHAALVAFLDLAHLVLEALECLEGTLVDDDVVAQQADAGAALDRTLGHHAARDLADLADVEDL